MSKLGMIAFKGESGRRYEFWMYPMGTKFKGGHGGVYFLTNRHDKGEGAHGHTRIYVGETDDLSSAFVDHMQCDVFAESDANCVCVHPTQDGHVRRDMVEDLIKSYDPPANRDSDGST